MKKGTAVGKRGLVLLVVMFFTAFAGIAEAAETWMKTYYFSGYSNFITPEALRPNSVQTADGGTVMAGHKSTYRSFDGVMRVYDEAVVFKVNSRGETGLEPGLRGGAMYYANSIQVTTDNGFIVAGRSGGNAWLLKLDGSGAIQWQKTYGGSGSSSATSVRQTSDGGYVMAGTTSGLGSTYIYGVMVWKVDQQGNIEWERVYGGAAARSVDIRQTAEGGYVLAANSWVSKLNGAGDIEWAKSLQVPTGVGFIAVSIVQGHDGGYAVAGFVAIPDSFTRIPYLVNSMLREPCGSADIRFHRRCRVDRSDRRRRVIAAGYSRIRTGAG